MHGCRGILRCHPHTYVRKAVASRGACCFMENIMRLARPGIAV
ncbi:MAG TPA: hypothetical protein DEF41_02185 [Desulfovibrio sp.]|nr:hypothetical protein [Desulfovibrio sp.]